MFCETAVKVYSIKPLSQMLIDSKFCHILTAIHDICCVQKLLHTVYNILLTLLIEYHQTDQLRPFTCYACMGGGACHVASHGA